MTTNPTARSGDIGDIRRCTLGGTEDLTAFDAFDATVWTNHPVRRAVLDVTLIDAVTREVDVSLGEADGWLATADKAVWFIVVRGYVAGTVLLSFPVESVSASFLRTSACTITVTGGGEATV